MGRPAWTAESNRPGPRWSHLPFGGFECQEVVAADLSPRWREWLADCPDGDFARFGLIKQFAKAYDSALRRGYIERCGYHSGGQWQHRLTDYGRAVKQAILARRADKAGEEACWSGWED